MSAEKIHRQLKKKKQPEKEVKLRFCEKQKYCFIKFYGIFLPLKFSLQSMEISILLFSYPFAHTVKIA